MAELILMKDKYILVDWSRPAKHERLNPKPISMTKEEAQMINNRLLLNGESFRYIKKGE